MKRAPTPTKKERKAADAAQAHARLCSVVDRLRPMAEIGLVRLQPARTPFERAAIELLVMYQGAPAEEVTDAALAMLEIATAGGISIEEACQSLAGICADETRRDAVKETMDSHTMSRLRLLFTRLPTSPTILARSAEFDASIARLATEIQQ